MQLIITFVVHVNGLMAVERTFYIHQLLHQQMLSPPVIIEIQNVVDKQFIRRLIKYCGHIIDKYQVEPIALTICINSTRREITKKLTETDKAPFMKRLPSDE
ncbi:uncharacterized protein BX663DRAFT_507950 [Cokeromyces recurvatus]|uniref:uncharacterized protein n=1 Tax=Cokeromyces recurvatus TaxID=90255 RepID=UPI00221E6E1E|nr:uncharacterized protein BX663DRAFT_507950 [Cokeromyces recurvatus]KAI7903239.1 hypothetical protein BX663DRAFT_507950 [Cokeromyces recurvatus]